MERPKDLDKYAAISPSSTTGVSHVARYAKELEGRIEEQAIVIASLQTYIQQLKARLRGEDS